MQLLSKQASTLKQSKTVGLHLDAVHQLGIEAGRINYDIALWAHNEVACTSVAQLCMRAALTYQLQLHSRYSVSGNSNISRGTVLQSVHTNCAL